MKTRLLYIFTRTPLHVGAGASVGAIDQPIIRERHTGFPIIPGSSLKGTFADYWNDTLREEQATKPGEPNKRVRVTANGDSSDAAWLFGSDNDKHAAAGSLQFSEARTLAFPIRSARGSFAWITSPLALRRALRDGLFDAEAAALINALPSIAETQAIFAEGKLDLSENENAKQIVLEEYTFSRIGGDEAEKLAPQFAALLPDDPVWQEIPGRLVIVSDSMMTFFVQNACEIAQHVRINDETGTADGGALFNQENVPSETMFYSVLNAFDERHVVKSSEPRQAEAALEAFAEKLANPVFQFGGDASTGLGYCTVKLGEQKGA